MILRTGDWLRGAPEGARPQDQTKASALSCDTLCPPCPRPQRSLPVVPPETARRLLLAGQGLADDPRQAATPEAIQARIEAMGFVQVDSINVVERAHHLILASRFDGYRPALLPRLLERERTLFENWTHDAAAIPTRWFPYWRVRFERYRGHTRAWWKERLGTEPERLLTQVLLRIEREGPLMAKDFAPESNAGSGSWWGWRPEKAALEHLWRTGRLAIANRVHFHKVYDLTERVLPEAAALPRPSDEEHRAWACSTALERLGIATTGEIADFWHALSPEEAGTWCEEAAARGEIEPVLSAAVDDSRPRRAWALPDWEERAAQAPEPPPRMRLLAPFDPILKRPQADPAALRLRLPLRGLRARSGRGSTATTSSPSSKATAWWAGSIPSSIGRREC